jgi:hypothetical protein
MDNGRVGFPACQSRPSIRSADFPACGRGNTLCPDQPPLPARSPCLARATPGEPKPRLSTLPESRSGRRLPGKAPLTVTFTARKSPVQAPSLARQPAPAARVRSICAQRPALHLCREAQRSGIRCWRLLGGVLQVESPAARVSVARLLFQQDSL